MPKIFRFVSDEFLNFELLRILTTAPFGGSDIAEFLESAALATSGSGSTRERWHLAWEAAGERAEAIAARSAERGDLFSARRAYLRASNYFRASQYMMSQSELHRIMPIYERSVRNFKAALPLLDCITVEIDIPYKAQDGKTYQLPGYMYLPLESKRMPVLTREGEAASANNQIPVLLNTCGADSSQEEHYFMFPSAGVELGYAVMTFEGPGQGIVLRQQGLTFRPDWEVVTSAALDALFSLAIARPELGLDTSRVALVGTSLGGYFALRGAIDRRVAACVSIDPLYNLWDFVRARLPSSVMALWENGWLSDGVLDSMVGVARYFSDFQSMWEFEMSKWMFGKDRPSQLFRRVMQFTLGGEAKQIVESKAASKGKNNQHQFLHQITCPVLITGAGQSLYFKIDDTTNKIYRQLANVPEGDKAIWAPYEPSLGGLQAKVGAFGMVQMETFVFLDDKFGIQREPLVVPSS